MSLSSNDIAYIAKHTKITPEKVLSLCSEERYLNLVLDAICGGFSKTDAPDISHSVYVKLVTFKNAKDKQFDIDEKSYVASSVAKYVNQLKNKVKLDILNGEKIDENYCQYSLVASGLFATKLKPEYLSKKSVLKLENAFIEVGMRDMGHHVNDWLEVLNRIHKGGWFKTLPKDK